MRYLLTRDMITPGQVELQCWRMSIIKMVLSAQNEIGNTIEYLVDIV